MEVSLASVFWRLAGVLALVFANGFFVAAEFSIVTVRKTRIDQLVAEGHRGARAVRRAVSNPDSYIAATQPPESAIAMIHACLDSLAAQGLALKQIDLALILARLYMQAEQPQEAERHSTGIGPSVRRGSISRQLRD